MLDRIVSALIAQKDEELMPARVPAQCVVCGLTMRAMTPSADAATPPTPPTIPMPATLEAIEARFRATRLPPCGNPGWTLVKTQFPCGHLVHEHCSIVAQLGRPESQDRLHCPMCGEECTSTASNYYYGVSGTYEELEIPTACATCHLGPEWEEQEAAKDMDPRVVSCHTRAYIGAISS